MTLMLVLATEVMAEQSIFAGQELVPPGREPSWLGWLLRDVPAAVTWRATIDEWLEHDEDGVRHEYRQRLLDEGGGRAAYNELVTRRILLAMFGDTEREPGDLPVDGKPDFAVRIGDARTAVEVATLAQQLPENYARRLEIIKRLKTIHGPWVLIPNWRSPGLYEASLDVVETKVKEYLEDANSAEHWVELDLGDNRRFQTTVRPGKNPAASVAIFNMITIANPGVGQVQREIKDKGGKYSKLKGAGIPLVVALFAESPLVDEESLFDALYGQQTINVWLDNESEVQSVEEGPLAQGGKLMPKRGGQAYYTTVSAVWFIQELPWVDNQLTVRLVELPNPWARNPIDWKDERASKVRIERTKERFEFFPPQSQIAFKVP